MNALAALPPWIALATAILVFAGALLACIGSAGLLRLDTFYRRVHAPTLGTTLGMYLVLAGTIVFFWAGKGQPALHVVLVGVCVSVTTPISLMLLARAALERDRRAGMAGVPAAASSESGHENHSSGR
ncbi:MAG TPA: monovalent cation/H(+) antiporter subunit G [Rhodanobacteraceae bacterium]|jgi:multicomponent K+:H+ antiporter subunit G|nr:monovalent cation/H(+) antiporter subunit G [Rhodanobacteraceae bacterium]